MSCNCFITNLSSVNNICIKSSKNYSVVSSTYFLSNFLHNLFAPVTFWQVSNNASNISFKIYPLHMLSHQPTFLHHSKQNFFLFAWHGRTKEGRTSTRIFAMLVGWSRWISHLVSRSFPEHQSIPGLSASTPLFLVFCLV